MRRMWTVSLVVGLLLCCAASANAASSLGIDVLSNRADVISAGDALVEVRIPAGVNVSKVRVFDDGRDVTSAFAVRPNGRFEGLVTGLSLGPNVLTARAPGAKDATRRRHEPSQRRSRVLGPAGAALGLPGDRGRRAVQPAGELRVPLQDARAARSPTTTRRARRPTSPTTTTDQGKTVPYVVRVETGYQDRDQYKIAVLYDPTKPWTAWEPQTQWNHKLLINHGASCGIERQAGSAPDVENDAALSRGFAVMSTALNNAGHNCNIVTQAESMVMAKERLVEQYGEIRYTIGTGCSGGALAQQQVANAYPGIYQGILPACSFPDAWSTGQQLVDYHLVRQYAENPSKWGTGVVWDPLSIAAVEGHPNHVNSIVFDTVYWTSLGDPDDGCPGVPGRGQLQRADQSRRRSLHAGRLHDQRHRAAALERLDPRRAADRARLRRAAARQRRRPVRARGAEEGPDHDGAVRRPERQDRRRGHRQQPDARALPGGPARARRTPTAAAA